MNESAGRPGRRPGRVLSQLEQEHLELLAGLRTRAGGFAAVYEEELEDFVARLLADGCSVRSVASAIGVSASTIQKWKKAARLRR